MKCFVFTDALSARVYEILVSNEPEAVKEMVDSAKSAAAQQSEDDDVRESIALENLELLLQENFEARLALDDDEQDPAGYAAWWGLRSIDFYRVAGAIFYGVELFEFPRVVAAGGA